MRLGSSGLGLGCPSKLLVWTYSSLCLAENAMLTQERYCGSMARISNTNPPLDIYTPYDLPDCVAPAIAQRENLLYSADFPAIASREGKAARRQEGQWREEP